MYTYYIALGSNMGNRRDYLNSALIALATLGKVVANSSWIETEPWGNTDQDRFLNGVCLVESELDPEAMLEKLQSIEQLAGRERTIHWGPRTLDLDIIWITDDKKDLVNVASETLEVPHPYFWDRPFVLEPLREVAPRFTYKGQSIPNRLAELAKGE